MQLYLVATIGFNLWCLMPLSTRPSFAIDRHQNAKNNYNQPEQYDRQQQVPKSNNDVHEEKEKQQNYNYNQSNYYSKSSLDSRIHIPKSKTDDIHVHII
jgi:hypothetical protein